MKDDRIYLGHMLDMARKAVGKTRDVSRAEYGTIRMRIYVSPWHILSRSSAKLRVVFRLPGSPPIPKFPGTKSQGCGTRSSMITWMSMRTLFGKS
jgi:hypothetical protein